MAGSAWAGRDGVVTGSMWCPCWSSRCSISVRARLMVVRLRAEQMGEGESGRARRSWRIVATTRLGKGKIGGQPERGLCRASLAGWAPAANAGRRSPTCRSATAGSFSYIDATLADATTLELCRLRYVGSAHDWQVAIYRASHDYYDESVFFTGLPSAPAKTPSTPLRPLPSTTPPPGPTPDELQGRPLILLFNLLLSCWFPAPWRLCRRRGGWRAGGSSSRAGGRNLAVRVSVRS